MTEKTELPLYERIIYFVAFWIFVLAVALGMAFLAWGIVYPVKSAFTIFMGDVSISDVFSVFSVNLELTLVVAGCIFFFFPAFMVAVLRPYSGIPEEKKEKEVVK
jgi:hypothetical protein